jgi:hypothetical protein
LATLDIGNPSLATLDFSNLYLATLGSVTQIS